jgi:DnaJ family protein C protein 28
MSSSAQEKRQAELQRLKWKLEERQLPDEVQSQRSLARREQDRTDLIEQRIQEAMANGEFDNLRGKGKPLPLNANPYLDRSQELAFGLLQNNGFAPEWIERDKEIRQEIDTARERLQRAWQEYLSRPADGSTWQRAVSRFEETLGKINRKIDGFNLITPVLSCQRPRLRLADELRRVQK